MISYWVSLKIGIGTWNPWRLRRLLKNARNATDANAYGWANTHIELLELKERIHQLEAERDQWQTKAVSND